MAILIATAFLAGLATILSPCILPILPLVLSGSITGGKRRPLGVVLGFITSFTFVALALNFLVRSFGIDINSLRVIAIVILIFFGLTLLIPQLQIFWEKLTSKLASRQAKTANDGFIGGIVIGISLGFVWAPCAGPIMASVLALAATQAVTIDSVLITLAYSIGATIPMLGIVYLGRKLLFKSLLKSTGLIQKIFGVIIIAVAIAISQGWDLRLLEKLEYGSSITKLIEENENVNKALDKLSGAKELETIGECKLAPEITAGGPWINSEALSLEELRGKVVLVKFWTYTCINCIRTFPYVNEWQEKYADDGLVIVGVHSPEFAFEKDYNNLLQATKDNKITYPVVQDNDFAIWRAYNNRYWPAKYLIDKNGCVRDTHFGEGAYAETEALIQELLKETGAEVKDKLSKANDTELGKRTPERYLGYERTTQLGSPEKINPDTNQLYSLPKILKLDHHALEGTWNVQAERALPAKGAKLHLNFQGKEVFLVMNADKKRQVKVLLDNIAPAENSGEDLKQGIVEVEKDRLYKLIKLPAYENHTLTLEFIEPGVEVYAFTFG